MNDNELLRDYVRNRSEVAFTEFVRRHLDIVYSAALRRVHGDSHRAEDIAQAVFADLARKAASLVDHPALIAWLYTSTYFTAAKLMRTERRQQSRDHEVHLMNELLADSSAPLDWNALRPVLDDALHDLNERERTALVLRFFEQCSMAELGVRLGLSERGARKRMDRALENLRTRLSRRGITSTSAALTTVLASQTVSAAPAGLVNAVSHSALSPTAAAASAATGSTLATLALLTTMSTAKTTILAGLVGLAVLFYFSHESIGISKATDTVTVSKEIKSTEEAESLKTGSKPSIIGIKPSQGVASESRNTPLPFAGILPSGVITEPFIASFPLDPVEADRIQSSINRVLAEIAEEASNSATVVRSDSERIIIRVPPYDKAPDVYTSLMQEFDAILGHDRSIALENALGADALHKSLFSFGAEERTLMIFRSPNEDARYRYQIIENHQRGASAAGNLKIIFFKGVSEIPVSYSWLSKYGDSIQGLQVIKPRAPKIIK